MAATEATPNNSPFLKQLASSSSLARSEALDQLRQYLRTRNSFTHLELLKLWKGLFYCVWHSDRPKAQQSLARDLAALTHQLRDDQTTAQWLTAFWETMAREWDGIPALRMDKFLYLCRCYVGAGYEWARRAKWDEGRIETVNGIMEEIPLSLEFERRDSTNGLRLHILDVWVDELEKCRDEGEDMPLELLLQPVQRLAEKTKDKSIRKRAKETLADERLGEWSGKEPEDGEAAHMDDASPVSSLNGAKNGPDAEDDEWGGIDEG